MALKVGALRSKKLSLALEGIHKRKIKERPSLQYFLENWQQECHRVIMMKCCIRVGLIDKFLQANCLLSLDRENVFA